VTNERFTVRNVGGNAGLRTQKTLQMPSQTSPAIVEAALYGDWQAVSDILRSRVELEAKRWAQRSLDLPLTPWDR